MQTTCHLDTVVKRGVVVEGSQDDPRAHRRCCRSYLGLVLKLYALSDDTQCLSVVEHPGVSHLFLFLDDLNVHQQPLARQRHAHVELPVEVVSTTQEDFTPLASHGGSGH